MNIIILTIVFVLLLAFLYGLYIKNKLVIYLSGFFIFLTLIWFVYTHYFKKVALKFLFTNDAENVVSNPEMYCGDEEFLPREYDFIGTRNKCLKKGVGVGMGMPDAKRNEFLARERPPDNGERIYCGDKEQLPEGYTSFGTKTRCMKKGVGIGMAMPEAKRYAFQHNPTRKLGKKEIMDLSKRLGINTQDKTRRVSVERIIQKLENLNL